MKARKKIREVKGKIGGQHDHHRDSHDHNLQLNHDKHACKNITKTTLVQHKTSYYNNDKVDIKNCKYKASQKSPMRLKIIRSRETSPELIKNPISKKVMGNISVNKI